MQKKIIDFFPLQKPDEIKYVTATSLAEWLNRSFTVLVVDVRFPYEFAGGHITGAVNTPDPNTLWETLGNWEGTKPIVMHCEYSQKRGVMMSRWLRNFDRQINLENYPKLSFPNLYILGGGYSEFYSAYPELCEPKGYVAMTQPEFKVERHSCCHKLRRLFKRFNY